MVAEILAAAAGFYADQLHFLVSDKIVENPNCVRASAHARNDRGRQFALDLQYLRSRFMTDHFMEIAHHRRIRMCP